jgi:hypothetical protein
MQLLNQALGAVTSEKLAASPLSDKIGHKDATGKIYL